MPCTLFFIIHLLVKDSSYSYRSSVICFRNLDSSARRACVYNLAVSDINSHMSGITNQITRLCIFQSAHIHTYISVSCRRMRKGYAEVLIYAHYKPGTICTVGKACPAIYIGVTHKLYCVIRNCTSVV